MGHLLPSDWLINNGSELCTGFRTYKWNSNEKYMTSIAAFADKPQNFKRTNVLQESLAHLHLFHKLAMKIE